MLKVTQEQEKRDVQFIKFGPVKIDKTLSIPNVIQIAMLMFVIWAGGWKLYGEFVDMSSDINSIRQDLQNQIASQASVVSVYDSRFASMSDRITQQGIEIALSKQRLDQLATSIDKLTDAIERFRETSATRPVQ